MTASLRILTAFFTAALCAYDMCADIINKNMQINISNNEKEHINNIKSKLTPQFRKDALIDLYANALINGSDLVLCWTPNTNKNDGDNNNNNNNNIGRFTDETIANEADGGPNDDELKQWRDKFHGIDTIIAVHNLNDRYNKKDNININENIMVKPGESQTFVLRASETFLCYEQSLTKPRECHMIYSTTTSFMEYFTHMNNVQCTMVYSGRSFNIAGGSPETAFQRIMDLQARAKYYYNDDDDDDDDDDDSFVDLKAIRERYKELANPKYHDEV